MEPIKFKEQNCTFAEHQPEYIPLPSHKCNNEHGDVIFCMGLSLWERIRLLFTGKLWVSLLMFGKPLTPSKFSVYKWKMLNKEYFKSK